MIKNTINLRLFKKKYIQKDSLKKWTKWLNDKDVTKFSNQRFKKHTLLSQKKFLIEKLKKRNSILFQIFYNYEFVGVIEISNIDLNNLNCEIMYMLGEKKYWSRGIISQSIRLVIKYIKSNMSIKKIYAGCSKSNKASIKVLKKNFFKVEGEIKNFLALKKKNRLLRDNKVFLGLDL